jgi:hypothetical protein
MKRFALLQLLLLSSAAPLAFAISSPQNLVSLTGDKSVILHWDRNSEANLAGYRAYRSTTGVGGPFTLLNTSSLLTGPGYCDINTSKVVNGQTNFYYVTAVDSSSIESAPSATNSALPQAFASDDAFLDYVQHACFYYFWYSANPANGLVPDRSANGSACSIAAVGFGLTAIGIAVDHGWISRAQAVARVLTTLNTFWSGPQGPGTTGIIGYQGWFYHFIDMNTAVRANSELSTIDTTWLLAGILYAKQYFNGPSPDEASIRSMADAIFNRVNWTFMMLGGGVATGWQPTTGFSGYGAWVGYNEGMMMYLLGLGIANNPLPASAWNVWTSAYSYGTYFGQTFMPFSPMFGHEYSHSWVDYRHIADNYMNSHNSTYFENSRRAALAQVAYAVANPNHESGYSSTIWGLTASDGPSGYAVHGIPPNGSDDGTIAPTAAGGAIAFAPEYALPSLKSFYSRFRTTLWSEYGFRDAFNIGLGWTGPDELGIDQGPIVIMIENYRTQRVWQLFMQNAEVQLGLQRAGFVPLPFVALNIQPVPAQGAYNLSWSGSAGRYYQVEYSPTLFTWAGSPGFVQATNNGTFNWLDAGPPATVSSPATNSQRFYRVYQLGTP